MRFLKNPRWAEGRCIVTLRPGDTSMWPDPPMVPTVALRRCEHAETIEQVRAIVHQFLPPRPLDSDVTSRHDRPAAH